MSAALLKIAKLIPRLGGASNEAESLVALRLIEKQLANEGLTFVDAGLKLQQFVTDVLKFQEPAEVEPPRKPATGFSSARPAPATGYQYKPQQPPPPPRQPQSGPTAWGAARSAGPQPQAQPRPGPFSAGPSAQTQAQPPPRAILWSDDFKVVWNRPAGSSRDAALNQMTAERCELLLDRAKIGGITLNSKEIRYLNDLYFKASSGLSSVTTLTVKQRDYFFTLADRLP